MADNDYQDQPTENPEQFPVREAPKKMGDHDDPNARVHYGTVINVPLCSLTHRKVTELNECFIALYETFVIYRVWGRYEEPESSDVPEGAWREVKCNYRWTRARCDIAEVSMHYDNLEKIWAVEMVWKGAGDYKWGFVKGSDAKKLHDVLQNYFITRDLPKEPIQAAAPSTPREGEPK